MIDTRQQESPPGLDHNPAQAPVTGEIIIAADNLTRRFGDQVAVQGVTFRIPRGVIFGYVGPSGSGKTTTIRLLTGVDRPTEGQVSVLGRNSAHFNESIRRRIGYMPQLFVLYPDLSVMENLNFAASIYGMGPLRGKQMNNVLSFVELAEHKHKVARQLSGGMQRRLSLAAALIHSPELLFLDEPTTGIDPMLRRKIWDYLKQLRQEGRTLFVTTHYVAEMAYCDMVGLMDEGRLLMVDTPDGLRRRAFGGDIVELRAKQPISYPQLDGLSSLPAVKAPVTRLSDKSARLIVDDASTAIPAILDYSKQANLDVEAVEESNPPFDDIFVELVRKGHTHG